MRLILKNWSLAARNNKKADDKYITISVKEAGEEIY